MTDAEMDRSQPVTPPLPAQTERIVMDVAIGDYAQVQVTAPCGLASPAGLIGELDEPNTFYAGERRSASLVWFGGGWVEYRVPYRLPAGARPVSLEVRAEICSDAPGYNDDWPSDITLWINNCDVGTWCCPGDFGGRQGRFTPPWWDVRDTQFGLLKRWRITAEGAFLDEAHLSTITIDDLALSGSEGEKEITLRIGIKSNAVHVGGLNLFGVGWGDHAQNLALILESAPALPDGSPP